MLGSSFLSEVDRRLEDLIGRVRLLEAQLSPSEINWKPADRNWTIGQIFEHLHLSTAVYVDAIDKAVTAAPFGPDREVRFSFAGRMLVWGNDPRRNPPAPKSIEPPAKIYTVDVIESFVTDHSRAREIIPRCEGIDLGRTRIASPIAPVIKLNLADVFEVLCVHSDRHVGQAEHITRREDFPR